MQIGTIEFKGAIALTLTPPRSGVIITTRHLGLVATVKGDRMAYQLQNDHLIVVKVSYVDAAGNPAEVDSVKWDTSNPTLVAVEEDSGDAALCTITPAGPLGQAQVTATADADLGDGVKNIVTTFDVTIVAGEAVAGTITPVGEPELIAPHVEPRSKKK